MVHADDLPSAPLPARQGKVLGFIGAKGGVGTTTVALNVAQALAMHRKSSVAVELRSSYGSFSHQLSCVPNENLKALLDLDPGDINEWELGRRLHVMPFGLNVLFGPQTVDEFSEITAGHAEAVIRGLGSLADHTVIDLPCGPSVASQTAVKRCSFVTLVVSSDPACIASAKVTLECSSHGACARAGGLGRGQPAYAYYLIAGDPITTELRDRWRRSTGSGSVPGCSEARFSTGRLAAGEYRGSESG